jgi:hypothetical protein
VAVYEVMKRGMSIRPKGGNVTEDDLMVVLHDFGQRVMDTLNNQKVKPPEGEFHGTVILVVAPNGGPDSGLNPLGASLNYEKGNWTLSVQLVRAERLEPE